MQEHKLLNRVADSSASSFLQPNLKKQIQLCNDVELNPGPKRQEETPIYDNPRVAKIGIHLLCKYDNNCHTIIVDIKVVELAQQDHSLFLYLLS